MRGPFHQEDVFAEGGGLSDGMSDDYQRQVFLAAQIELDVMIQSEQFEKAAIEQGYSKEQVTEALSKIAAKKVHKHLSTLATIGGLAPGKEDLNSLKPVQEKAVGEEKRRLPATHSLGGAR